MWDIIAAAGVLTIILIISIVLLQGKGGFMIAGFNMLSKEKKGKVDMVKLCKFMGKVSLGISCSCALILIYIITEIEVFCVIGLVVLAISAVIALVWSTIRYMAPARK